MSDDGKINSNFRGNKIPKEGLHCVCLTRLFNVVKSIILKYISEEYKYKLKNKKTNTFINDDIETSSSDNDDDDHSREKDSE